MTSTTISLDKQAYPLMMHLSILPKYGITLEEPIYDPGTQTLKVDSMSGSWCNRNRSTGGVLNPYDDDSKQDD